MAMNDKIIPMIQNNGIFPTIKGIIKESHYK